MKLGMKALRAEIMAGVVAHWREAVECEQNAPELARQKWARVHGYLLAADDVVAAEEREKPTPGAAMLANDLHVLRRLLITRRELAGGAA